MRVTTALVATGTATFIVLSLLSAYLQAANTAGMFVLAAVMVMICGDMWLNR